VAVPPPGRIVADIGGPLRPVRRAEFDVLALHYPYYRARWGYTSAVCSVAADLIGAQGLTSALELGPHIRSVIVGADVMELRLQPGLESEGEVIQHDARVTPWPIEDERYDLFVALQVFEHLGTEQSQAFREVRRVARNAIISLPIDWEMPDPTNCHHRISNERALSWFAPTVPTRILQGNPGPRRRMIYVFEHLDE
jgi:hypothetical protein